MTTLPARIASGEVEAPDLFCGGTPCQAFSVAGLRKSLDDARGNLSLTFCEISDAIDNVRLARGEPASIVFWENVPGVLSTKDNAFGCFLGALSGSDTAIVPSGRWTDAGVVDGPKRTVAWRTLDAQYFGVAQRRRRVFVVASARDDFDTATVLLEWEGLRRDSAPSREAGQKPAGTFTARAHSGGGFSTDFECDGGVIQQPIAQCLTTGTGQRYDPETETLLPCVFPTLEANDGKKWGSNQWVNQGKAIVQPVAQPLGFSGRGDGSDALEGITPTMRSLTQGADGHQSGSVGLAVATVAAFKGGQGSAAGGIGYDEHVAPTLSAADSGSNRTPALLTAMQVRRLTPVECERLQGFPDNYTAIPWRGKPVDNCPDGPRYKALGNSWAVPVVRWIGKRIQERLNAP
jgi:DNA (cytosine-5)-methyltransferase 1